MTGPARPTGVLLMAHGTPAAPEEIEPFYTAIRRGRPPPPELLAELTARYQAIGGTSPLTERTAAQVAAVAASLDASSPGRYTVRYGAKFAAPSIETGMAELVDAGVDRVVGVVLTPHEAASGSGEYLRRAATAAAAARPAPTFVPVRHWHRAPGLAPLLADRTAAALDTVPADRRADTAVFFTAHSLPVRALSPTDPYPVQVAESAADVAALLDLESVPGVRWGVAWQSAGRTPDPWLGPALLEEIRRVAEDGATAVVVCPVGFVSDHLEILYDLDLEAASLAAEVGLAFVRSRSLNDDPRFVAVLADVVRAAAEHPGVATPAPDARSA